MIIVSKSRRLVVHLQPVLLVFAVVGAACTVPLATGAGELVVMGALALVLLVPALALQRAVRRTERGLEVWTVLGRRRVEPKGVFLGINTDRGGVLIELIMGGDFVPDAPAILVSRHLAFGLAPAVRAGRRIAEALELPGPRIAPWLEQHSAPGPGSRSGARPFPWPRVLATVGLIAAAAIVALGTVVANRAQQTDAELFLHCRRAHRARTDPESRGTIGTLIVPHSKTYWANPGPTRIDVWDPARRCWAGQEFALEVGRRTSIDLDDLVERGACSTQTLPP